MEKNVFSLKSVADVTRILLKGLGQIMLQESALTGGLFLAGILIGSPIMGVAAVLAVCIGTRTAVVLKYDRDEIRKGLYGFSPALAGVAMMVFFEPSIVIWMAIIIGAAAASILQHYFIVRKLPVFTLPFVLVTWGFLFLFFRIWPSGVSLPSAVSVDTSLVYGFIFRGYGQIIFQPGMLSGLLFLLGVFVHTPLAALFGVAGGLIAAALAFVLDQPVGDIQLGLSGFNAVLCAITFAGAKTKDVLITLVSILLSTLISIFMQKNQWIQLTFPFVVASFICTYLAHFLRRRQNEKISVHKVVEP